MSPTTYLRRQPRFLMTFHSHWEERIGDERLYLRERLFAVAMARTNANLHTPVEEGELAQLLGKWKDGEYKPADRRDLDKATKRNIELGLFEQGSDYRRCLILPPQGFDCRRQGSKTPCRRCEGRATRISKDFAAKDLDAELAFDERLRGLKERAAHRALFAQ